MLWKYAARLLIPVVSLAQGQPDQSSSDEAAIRALIAHPEQIKSTDHAVFWSGAYKRPAIFPEHGEPYSKAGLDKRKNQMQHYNVQRIDVASSRDMAYEFSYGKLEFDVEGMPPQHATIDQGLLRVWKKVGGEWRVAAMFVRPLDVPFGTGH